MPANTKSQFATELLRQELGDVYTDSIGEELRPIWLSLQERKCELAKLVDSGQMSVVEFAQQLNQSIVAAASQIRGIIGPAHAASLLGASDSGLLDLQMAAAEDEKRKRRKEVGKDDLIRKTKSGTVGGRRHVARTYRLKTGVTKARGLTKAEVLNRIAATADMPKEQVAAVVAALTAEMKKCLGAQGTGVFTIPGLVKIEKRRVPARPAKKGVPKPFKPGELIDLPAKPAHNKVKVRALKMLKEMVQ